ncbi:MAG TPA: DUF6603 domain-containing protein [Chthoniobacterales bacterium]
MGQEIKMTTGDFLNEIVWFVAPLTDAAQSTDDLIELFGDFGYELNEDDATAISKSFQSVTDLVGSIFASSDDEDDNFDPDELLELFASITAVAESEEVKKYVGLEFFDEVFDYLLCQYLFTKQPLIYAILYALGVIETKEIAAGSADPDARDVDYTQRLLLWSRISDFVSNTAQWAKDVYGWAGDPTNPDEIQFDYTKCFVALRLIIESTGFGLATIDSVDESELSSFLKNTTGEIYLSAVIPIYQTSLDDVDDNGKPVFLNEAGFKLLPYGDMNERQNLGFAFAPYVQGDVSAGLKLSDTVTITTAISSDATGGAYVTLTPQGVSNTTGASTDAGFEVKVIYSKSDAEPISLLTVLDDSHISVSEVDWVVGGNISGDIYLEIRFEDLQAVLDVGDDSFLGNVITEPISLEVGEIIFGWSYQNGVTFEAGDKLGIAIPLNLEAGPIAVHEIDLEFDLSDTPKFSVEVTGDLTLGPVVLTARGFGVYISLISSEGGLLGKYDLHSGLVPPDGLGLVLEMDFVTGGGYLSFDPDENQYAGTAELEFVDVALDAVGLVTTELPDGSDGWSMIICVATGFPPMPIGMGFFLEKVGGLFAYNRSFDEDVLRDGLKDGSLDFVLFPDDPVADAPEILSNLEAAFPTREGQSVFGPMAKIVWPAKSFVDVDLGILIEIGNSFRIAVLGQIAAALPNADNPLLEIHVDVLGVIDFDESTLSIDASIYDSHVANFNLNGDMALRLGWSGQPTFLLAVGGFHPDYNPPAGFPDLDRISVALDSDDPRISLEGYFALTSNTVQVGAELDISASLSLLSIEGYGGFDALFVLSPFSFEVEAHLGLDIQAAGKTLLGVDLSLEISGPQPWEVNGKVTIYFFGSHTFHVSLTIGSGTPQALESVNVLEDMLRPAIEDTRNWTAINVIQDDPGITFIESYDATGAVLVHPAGAVEFRQTVVPLDIDIDVYAGRPVTGPTRFDLSVTKFGKVEGSAESTPVEDWFAPGQYFELDDDDKLTAADYELLEAGLQVSSAALAQGKQVPVELGYETIIYAEDGQRDDSQPAHTLSPDELLFYAGSSATARARAAAIGATRFQGSNVSMQPSATKWSVVGVDDLKPTAIGDLGEVTATTYIEALKALQSYDGDAEIQIVAAHEANVT